MPGEIVFVGEAATAFGPAERAAVAAAARGTRGFRRGETIVCAGKPPTMLHLLLEGWAAKVQMLGDGSRQITDFILPGDFGDLSALGGGPVDQVVALTPATAVRLDTRMILEKCEVHPRLALSLLGMACREQAVLRAWVTCLGLREKREHLAHLICELGERLRRVGLVADHDFALPLTQTDLAEALGATTVHTNRVLQSLRKDGLIEFRDHQLHVIQPARLRELAEFDRAYLAA